MTRLLQTVIDSRNPRKAAEFYRAWLGWVYAETDDGASEVDWVVLSDPKSSSKLAFQLDEDFVSPTWPRPEVPQQLHLDFLAHGRQKMEADHAKLLELGATVLFDRSDDPHEPLRVYADLDGHPFCVFTWVSV